MDELRAYINGLRNEFSLQTLDEASVNKDPVLQFAAWFKEAVEAKIPDPNAMVISTVSPEGKPTSRVVLLRNFNEKGFTFYTNYNSKKGKDISVNPNVCLNFFWPQLERQLRVDGAAVMQTTAESDLYFNSRPKESKLGAWASPQSEKVSSRKEIDEKLAEITAKFNEKEISRPPFWGGYTIKPTSVEFWQGRPNRLHDRILYTLLNDDSWKIERLAP